MLFQNQPEEISSKVDRGENKIVKDTDSKLSDDMQENF